MISPAKAILDALFPNPCQGCGAPHDGDSPICHWCASALPRTGQWLDTQNPLFLRLAKVLPIDFAFSFLYFQKQEITQRLLHRLKYSNQPKIGLALGRLMGAELSTVSMDIEAVIPVPLHPQKLAKRGYNQASLIAQGVAETIGSKLEDQILIRTRKTQTQAKLNEVQRIQNVRGAFQADARAGQLASVLLVDDVLTTGATLGACAEALKQAGVGRITLCVVADAAQK